MGKKIYNRIDEILKWDLDGMTYTELSKKLGCDKSYVSKVAAGLDVKISTAQKYAKALNKPIDYIWPTER